MKIRASHVIVAAFLVFMLLATGTADGAILSPPPCDQVASWKITYDHTNAPADGSPANAIVRVTYLRGSGEVYRADDIRIEGAELADYLRAQLVPAEGEDSGWGPGRKKLYRLAKWLEANGKLAFGATVD